MSQQRRRRWPFESQHKALPESMDCPCRLRIDVTPEKEIWDCQVGGLGSQLMVAPVEIIRRPIRPISHSNVFLVVCAGASFCWSIGGIIVFPQYPFGGRFRQFDLLGQKTDEYLSVFLDASFTTAMYSLVMPVLLQLFGCFKLSRWKLSAWNYPRCYLLRYITLKCGRSFWDPRHFLSSFIHSFIHIFIHSFNRTSFIPMRNTSIYSKSILAKIIPLAPDGPICTHIYFMRIGCSHFNIVR